VLQLSIEVPDQAFAGLKFTASAIASNPGTQPLVDIRLTETHNLPGVTVGLPAAFDLKPGEQKTVNVDYTVADAGSFSFSATATGTAPPGYQPSATSAGSLMVVRQAVIKGTLDAPAAAVRGHLITYTVTANNQGQALLSQVVVSTTINGGSQTGDSFLSGATLQTGESRQFSGQVSRDAAGNVQITLNAAGSGPGPHNDSADSIQKTVKFYAPADVSVTVTIPASGTENSPMPFSVVVHNNATDEVKIEQITPTANLAGSFAHMAAPGAIPGGEQRTVAGTFTPSQTGNLTLTVTIDGTGAGGDAVQQSGLAHQVVNSSPPA
jgi:uncharacterized repeat protein (TIGR01451 family)